MKPEAFTRILDGLEANPEDRKLMMNLAQSLGLVIGNASADTKELALTRSVIDAGLYKFRKHDSAAHKRIAEEVKLLLDLAAAAQMTIETMQDDEALVGYISKPPYSIILPILEAESLRLSVLATRSGLTAEVVLDAVRRLCEAHVAEGHGKPDPLIRITDRGCHALEQLRAKQQKTPPAS